MQKTTIRKWKEIREGEGDRLNSLIEVAKKEGVSNYHHIIVWYMNRFPSEILGSKSYFSKWCFRYLKGTELFLSTMDKKSKDIFKKVFL